jgi:hypothetical protein
MLSFAEAGWVGVPPEPDLEAMTWDDPTTRGLRLAFVDRLVAAEFAR